MTSKLFIGYALDQSYSFNLNQIKIRTKTENKKHIVPKRKININKNEITKAY